MTLMENPAKFLSNLLIERKLRNKSYSARAFARDLGLSQPFLSQVLKGTRNLSLEQRVKLAARLGVDPGLDPQKIDPARYEVLHYTLEHEQILKHWCHFAIFEMVKMERLPNDAKRVARRLGISDLEARSAIDRLIEFGYLAVTPAGNLKRTRTAFVLDVAKSPQAVRDFHQARLRASLDELSHIKEEQVRNRFFQTLFVPTSRKKVQNAKKMISQFQSRLIEYLVGGESDEIFQLSLQLFSAEKTPRSET